MILAIDIGSTTIALGVFDRQTLVKDWRVRSGREKTAEEYGILLLGRLRNSGDKARD